MNIPQLKYSIIDNISGDATSGTSDEVVATLHAWFSEAPSTIHDLIHELEDHLDQGNTIPHGLDTALNITISRVPAITTETIAANCQETLEGIHTDYRENLLELTLNKSRNLGTWTAVKDAMQNIASILKMPTCDANVMHIDRDAIKTNCQETLNAIHPDHRDDLTATTLAEVGTSTELSWTEIEAVMKNVAVENEYRAVDADELNILELASKLSFTRVDGELCITEPTTSPEFQVVGVLTPNPEYPGCNWDVLVLEPGSSDVLAEGSFKTLIEALTFTAERLSSEWRFSNNKLVLR